MDTPEYQELLRQLLEVRRETRALRRWLIVISLGIVLLIPLSQGALSLQHVIDFTEGYVVPFAGVLLVAVLIAFIIAQRDRRTRHKHATRRRHRTRSEAEGVRSETPTLQ
jgi:hypothetical protein